MAAHLSKMEPRPLRARRSFSMLSNVGVPRGISRRLRSDAIILSASPEGAQAAKLTHKRLASFGKNRRALCGLRRLTPHAMRQRPVGGVHLVDHDETQRKERRHEDRSLFLDSAEEKRGGASTLLCHRRGEAALLSSIQRLTPRRVRRPPRRRTCPSI